MKHTTSSSSGAGLTALFLPRGLGTNSDEMAVRWLHSVADDEGRELIPARRLEYDTLILESSQNLFEVVR
jgi:hypothetical protein